MDGSPFGGGLRHEDRLEKEAAYVGLIFGGHRGAMLIQGAALGSWWPFSATA